MNQLDMLFGLFRKYSLHHPLGDDVRNASFASKKRVFKAVIRRAGRSGIVFGPAATLFLWLRERGKAVSFATSARILRGAMAGAACLVCVATGVTLWMTMPFGGGELSARRGTIIFTQGEVVIATPGTLPKTASVKDIIDEKAEITTGKKSTVSIQIDSYGVVSVQPESRLVMSAIAGKNRETALDLARGAVYSKLLKLMDRRYTIKTPTSVVSVRGTEFMTAHENGETAVELLRGSIDITVAGDPAGVTRLKAGESALVNRDRKATVSAIPPLRMLELEKLSLVPFIENANRMTSGEIIELVRKAREGEAPIEKEKQRIIEEWAKLPPLERIKKQGKMPFMFHLSDGSQIAGSVVSQDETTIRIDTGDGVATFNKDDIVRRVPIK